MSILHCLGPAHVYVGVNAGLPDYDPYATQSSVTPYYLGTAESAPFITIDPFFTPIPGSIGGACPIDYMFDGEEATIRLDLNRWNETVYRQCAARPDAQNNTRGSMTAKNRGSLMVAGGFAYPLWIQQPYSSKSIYSAEGALDGYRFLAAWLHGPDGIIPGTRANKRTCIFKAVSARATGGSWKLYDGSMAFVPAVPPTGSTGTSTSSS